MFYCMFYFTCNRCLTCSGLMFGLGGHRCSVSVLPGLSDGSSVTTAESKRRSRRRSHLPVLHLSSVHLLHGLAQGQWPCDIRPIDRDVGLAN